MISLSPGGGPVGSEPTLGGGAWEVKQRRRRQHSVPGPDLDLALTPVGKRELETGLQELTDVRPLDVVLLLNLGDPQDLPRRSEKKNPRLIQRSSSD